MFVLTNSSAEMKSPGEWSHRGSMRLSGRLALGLIETFCCAGDIGQGLILMEKYNGNRPGLFNKRKKVARTDPL